jgi:hypothetical protein
MSHLAVSLLSAAAMRRDPVLCDCVDQIEPSLAGAWGGSGAEERFGIGVARSVGKASGTEAEHVVREMLVHSGVADWHLFISEHVVPNAGPYATSIATFQDRSRYQWVDPAGLPAPYDLYRLPDPLRSSWKRQHLRVGLPWPVGRPDRDLRDKWIQRHRSALSGNPQWPTGSVDWAAVMAAVARFDAVGTWSPEAVDSFAAGLEPSISRGFVATLREPILLDPKAEQLCTGQHRALAALVQGVPRVLACTPEYR